MLLDAVYSEVQKCKNIKPVSLVAHPSPMSGSIVTIFSRLNFIQ